MSLKTRLADSSIFTNSNTIHLQSGSFPLDMQQVFAKRKDFNCFLVMRQSRVSPPLKQNSPLVLVERNETEKREEWSDTSFCFLTMHGMHSLNICSVTRSQVPYVLCCHVQVQMFIYHTCFGT